MAEVKKPTGLIKSLSQLTESAEDGERGFTPTSLKLLRELGKGDVDFLPELYPGMDFTPDGRETYQYIKKIDVERIQLREYTKEPDYAIYFRFNNTVLSWACQSISQIIGFVVFIIVRVFLHLGYEDQLPECPLKRVSNIIHTYKHIIHTYKHTCI